MYPLIGPQIFQDSNQKSVLISFKVLCFHYFKHLHWILQHIWGSTVHKQVKKCYVHKHFDTVCYHNSCNCVVFYFLNEPGGHFLSEQCVVWVPGYMGTCENSRLTMVYSIVYHQSQTLQQVVSRYHQQAARSEVIGNDSRWVRSRTISWEPDPALVLWRCWASVQGLSGVIWVPFDGPFLLNLMIFYSQSCWGTNSAPKALDFWWQLQAQILGF